MQKRIDNLTPNQKEKKRSNLSYLFLLFVIGVVSCIDAWLNLVYPVHHRVEENPIAKVVLISSNNNLALLIAAKALGTVVALTFLRHYYYYKMGQSYTIAGVLALLQVIFLCYIMMG